MEHASRRRFDLDFDGELMSEKLVSPIPVRYSLTGLHRLSTPGKLIQTPATRSAEAGKKKYIFIYPFSI